MKPIATISSTGVQNFSTNVSSETLSSDPPKKKIEAVTNCGQNGFSY